MIKKTDYFSFFSPPFSILALTLFRCAMLPAVSAEGTLSSRRLLHSLRPVERAYILRVGFHHLIDISRVESSTCELVVCP